MVADQRGDREVQVGKKEEFLAKRRQLAGTLTSIIMGAQQMHDAAETMNAEEIRDHAVALIKFADAAIDAADIDISELEIAVDILVAGTLLREAKH
jgi:hypothetical protein